MKKGILLLLAMCTLVSYAETSNNKNSTEVFGVHNRYDDAVTFVEGGIRFHVYLNGDFDFDSGYLWRNRRNRRVPIFRDFQGRINRVGTVRIRYDFQGNVRRIGQVTMDYRRGWLRRVGNLTIQYNPWGVPNFFGQVYYNGFYDNLYYDNSFNVNFNWNVGAICVYNDPYFYGNEFRRNYSRVREDANYIYYRRNSNATTSRDEVIRRRKPDPNATTKPVERDRRGGTQNTNATTNTTRNRPVVTEDANRERPRVNTTQNRRKPQVDTTQNNRRKVERNNSRTSENRKVTRDRTKKKEEVKKESSRKSRSGTERRRSS